ncbi:unnamed protein product [Paramecium sonneborni]|uniref:Uncharacterized protein n=1 Tax=Paramecium sonneborni TaxID=65129 RepID=A0A8S1NSV2_9CILI|nr:unnamed protein product [Paramecium sonneborni]
MIQMKIKMRISKRIVKLIQKKSKLKQTNLQIKIKRGRKTKKIQKLQNQMTLTFLGYYRVQQSDRLEEILQILFSDRIIQQLKIYKKTVFYCNRPHFILFVNLKKYLIKACFHYLILKGTKINFFVLQLNLNKNYFYQIIMSLLIINLDNVLFS